MKHKFEGFPREAQENIPSEEKGKKLERSPALPGGELPSIEDRARVVKRIQDIEARIGEMGAEHSPEAERALIQRAERIFKECEAAGRSTFEAFESAFSVDELSLLVWANEARTDAAVERAHKKQEEDRRNMSGLQRFALRLGLKEDSTPSDEWVGDKAWYPWAEDARSRLMKKLNVERSEDALEARLNKTSISRWERGGIERLLTEEHFNPVSK